MKILPAKGADLFVKTLEDLGVDVIFGIPGSHDALLYNALRKSSIRTVLTTNELHASFMANGYFLGSGKAGVMLAIAGPGFTNAVTGLTEAFFDSAGLVCIICKPESLPGNAYQLQKIDERDIVRTVTKGSFSITSPAEIEPVLQTSFLAALSGEPGPVLLEVAPRVLSHKNDLTQSKAMPAEDRPPPPDEHDLSAVVDWIASSPRIICYLGQGASGASEKVSGLVDLLQTPVLTTTSGRGIIPESHPLSLPSDLVEDVEDVNAMLASCDLILAMGCKFTHNGAKGFRLKLPEDKLVHVDASKDVLGANYPARIAIQADVPAFLDALWQQREKFASRVSGWKSGEIRAWRQSLIKNRHKKTFPEPQFEGLDPPTAGAFFAALRGLLPEKACLITDSGRHQMLARKYFEVSIPRGLIVPADFQSMGFGIPGGIGVKLADPERHVLVITGDGGFALCGMELATAVREKVNMTVILFNDSTMGLIRIHQLRKTGRDHAVTTGPIDYAKFCASLGIQYFKLDNNIHDVCNKSLLHKGVSLIEIVLKDTLETKKAAAKGVIRNILKI